MLSYLRSYCNYLPEAKYLFEKTIMQKQNLLRPSAPLIAFLTAINKSVVNIILKLL